MQWSNSILASRYIILNGLWLIFVINIVLIINSFHLEHAIRLRESDISDMHKQDYDQVILFTLNLHCALIKNRILN